MNRIVAALGASQIIGYGTLYYAFPLLVPHVAATFGQPEAVLYGLFSLGLLCGGLAAPQLGRLFDRHGSPRVMMLGSLAAGALVLCGAAAPFFWFWALAQLLTQVIAASVLYDAAFAALARLCGGAARTAIVRLTLIAGFASTIFWPLTGLLLEAWGWRPTMLAFGVLHLTLAFGLHWWLSRQMPVALSATGRPDRVFEPVGPGQARFAFAAVAVSFALTGMVVSALGVHMVPVLTAMGLGAGATLVAMLMGPAQVAIRLVNALFWPRMHPLTVAAIAMLALPLAVGCILSGLPAVWAAPVFAILFGVGQGLNSIVRGAVPLALFGTKGFGARLGRLAFFVSLAAAGAPFAFAGLRGQFGLTPTLWLFLAVGLVAALPILLLRIRIGRTAG